MSNDTSDVQLLLEKAGIIKEKYELENKDNEFNIFSIIRNESEEVGLHSRFIYELLNPEGVHNKGDIFLKSFLKHIDDDYDNFHESYLENVKVKKEYSHASGRIDLLICLSNKTFIIENKVYEPVDTNQLKDYYESLQNLGYPGIKVVLLTLSDHEFEEDEYEKLKDSLDGNLIMITYKEDIKEWLIECIKETAQSPLLRETLVMYKILALKLTGQTYSEGMVREMVDLIIESRQRFENALRIEEGLIATKMKIQELFWGELEEELEKYGYKKKQDEQYNWSKDWINRFYKYSRNCVDYGLSYVLIEDTRFKIIFWISIDKQGIHYSIFISDHSYEAVKGDEEREEYKNLWNRIRDNVRTYNPSYNEHYWCPVTKLSSKQLKFVDFNTEDTLALIETQSRKKIINEIAEEVNNDIKAFPKDTI